MTKQQKKRGLGRGVAIVGGAMSHFGAYPDKTSRDLMAEAYLDAMDTVDKGMDPTDIEALYIGNFVGDLFEGQGHLGHIIADWLGLAPRPATRVEGPAQAAASPSGKPSWRSRPGCTTWSWPGASRG